MLLFFIIIKLKMFSNNIFLFISYIIIKNIISQRNTYNDYYYDDYYYDDDSSNSTNSTTVIIAVIIYFIFMVGGILLCVYCCCYRNRNRNRQTVNTSPPNYLGGHVYLVPANSNQIVGQRIIIPNNIQQNGQYYNNNNINANQNMQFYQNGNYNVENQMLNLNSSNLEIQINYLFQNIMIPEIYTEKFGKEEKSCTICLNKFNLNKSKIVLTQCHHFFHFYCLKKYLLEGKGKKCPNCNHDFFETFSSIQIIPSKVKIVPLDERDNPNKEQ
jgi:hypothetical protein